MIFENQDRGECVTNMKIADQIVNQFSAFVFYKTFVGLILITCYFANYVFDIHRKRFCVDNTQVDNLKMA